MQALSSDMKPGHTHYCAGEELKHDDGSPNGRVQFPLATLEIFYLETELVKKGLVPDGCRLYLAVASFVELDGEDAKAHVDMPGEQDGGECQGGGGHGLACLRGCILLP